MKVKLTESQINKIIEESKLSSHNPCDSLSEGKKFCNTLSKILKGRSKLKTKAIEVFTKIKVDGDVFGTTINLDAGEPHYKERRKQLLSFYKLLNNYNSCSKMRDSVRADLESNLIDKNLKMVVNDDDEYSLFNRIDTHYSVQSYIITLIAQDINKNEDFKFFNMDTFDRGQVIEEVSDYILNDDSFNIIKSKLSEILDDEDKSGKIVTSLTYSKERGDEIELEVKNSLESEGYEVIDFGKDFGFVDYFGVDLVAIKDGQLYPIQASSNRKFTPKFYKYADKDCKCRSIYKVNGQFRVESPSINLSESIELLKDKLTDIGLDNIESLTKLKDEDITDDFLRNLDRKLLKSGDTKDNVKNYIIKYIDSLQTRNQPQQEPEDNYFVDDDEEQEKSKIGRKSFIKELRPLQVELLKLQEHVKKTGKSVVIVFEGRDSAGKGSTIKKFIEYLQPQYYKVVALGIPTPEEKKNWFDRYEREIESGKIIFFDRSWYNRGIVEPVMGYSTMEEYTDFMENVGSFESSLLSKGHDVFKFWLSITQDTQRKRFDMRKNSPLKYWKFSPNDEASIDKWDDYTEYKEKALKQTAEVIPWSVVDTNDKRAGALNSIRTVLNKVDYEGKDDKNLGMIYPEVVTTVNEDDDIDTDETQYDFYKGEYIQTDKSFIAAYLMGEEIGKQIEVLNLREYKDNYSMFMNGYVPYSVTTHKTLLPLSQIEILGDVPGKEGFKFIKIPYWLFKKKQDDLKINRLNEKKALYLTSKHRSYDQLEQLFTPEFEHFYNTISYDNVDRERMEIAKKNHQRTKNRKEKEGITEDNSFMRRRTDKVIFRKTVSPNVKIVVTKYANGQIVDIENPRNIRFPYQVGQVMDRGHETWAHVNGYEISKDGFNYKGGPEKKKFGIPVSMLPPHLKNL